METAEVGTRIKWGIDTYYAQRDRFQSKTPDDYKCKRRVQRI